MRRWHQKSGDASAALLKSISSGSQGLDEADGDVCVLGIASPLHLPGYIKASTALLLAYYTDALFLTPTRVQGTTRK